jgi:hypothetical protein
MVKVLCDLCGKEIEDSNHQVNFDINAYGCSGFFPKEYNYHVECARKIEALIKETHLHYCPYTEGESADGGADNGE